MEGAPELIDRDQELATLARVVDASAAGTGAVALVEGDAGAGKTSLLAWAADAATQHGFQVLRARGGALERTFGFGVARQLLEHTIVRGDAEEHGLLDGAAGLAATALGLSSPADRDAPGVLDDLQARHGLYWLVANLADRLPLALVVDDAQWCDQPTLDWLLYLLRRIEKLPVLVLLAVRSGEPDTPRRALEELAAEPIVTTIRLRAFAPAGTAALLRSIYGTAVEPAFASACHAWTAGNPHFIVEVATELIAEGLPPLGSSAAKMQAFSPRRITQVTLLRLGRLPPPAVALARAAATLGSDCELRHAAALAGLGEQEGLEALEALAAAGVLTPGTPLRFVHPLVASVIYDDLPPARRAADHDRAARMLAQDDADAQLVTAQLMRTTPAGDAWVVDQLRGLAAAQLTQGSASSAVPLLRRARAEPPGDEALAGVLFLLGLSEAASGDPDGLGTLGEAFAAAKTAVERAGIGVLLSRFLLLGGFIGPAVDTVAPVIAELGEEHRALRLQLEAALINAARSDIARRELADEHLATIRGAAGEDSHEGRLVAAVAAYAETARGDSVKDATRLARSALAGDRLLRETPMNPDAYLVPMAMLALCDELDEAELRFGEALAHAQARGSAVAYAATASLKSWAAYLLGSLDEAELLARDAQRLAAGNPALGTVIGFAGAFLAITLVERGRHDEALALIEVELARAQSATHVWGLELLFARGRALTATRQAEAGLDALLACGRSCDAFGISNPAMMGWRGAAALALRELGDSDAAGTLSGGELRLARRFGARRSIGTALRAHGLVVGGERGLEHLRESVDVLRDSPAALERAHSLVALGAALRRSARRRDAHAPLAEGLALAERAGAAELAAHARVELSAGPRRSTRAQPHGRDELTASERRVCEMAASGLSNPAIAQALFVTRGTVESHLHAAYRKLGITSRTELAAALAAPD